MALMGGYCRYAAVISELVLLFGILCLSGTAAVTIFLLKNDFNGECPLYPTIADLGYFNFEINDVISCNYIIAANVVSAGLSLIAIIYASAEIAIKKRLISFMPTLKTILYGIFIIIVGVAAGIITVGFLKLCSGLDLLVDEYHDYNTCKEWQQDGYWKIYDYDASHFYVYILVAQTATIVSAVIWVILTIISLIALVCFTSRSQADDDQTLIL